MHWNLSAQSRIKSEDQKLLRAHGLQVTPVQNRLDQAPGSCVMSSVVG
jgi:hypothetical protein